MKNKEVRFRPLQVELGIESLASLAGYHDFERVLISPEYMNDPLVIRHEGYHDQFLLQTPFGKTQFVFRAVLKRAKEEATKTNAAIWLERLFNASKLTHECGATYLSIKSFPYASHSKVLSQHPTEYRNYYSMLAEVIDPVFNSSYVQFLVGKLMVEVCLAPRIQEYLSKWSLGLPIRVDERDAPDRRLKSLLDLLKYRLSELHEVLREEIANNAERICGSTRFDFQNEDSWLSIFPEQAEDFEGVIDTTIRNWFYPIAQSLWPCLLPEEWEETSSRFLQAMASSGVNLLEDQRPAFVSRDSLDQESLFQAIRYGITTIDNRKLADNVRLKLSFMEAASDPFKVFLDPPGPRIFITDTPGNREFDEIVWNRFINYDTSHVLGDKVSHEEMKRALMARNVIASLGMPAPELDLIVGLHSDLRESATKLHSEILACQSIPGSRTLVDPNRAIWYMGGDFLSWYDYLILQGDLEFLPLYDPQTIFPDPAQKSIGNLVAEQALEPMWLILRSSRVRGLFLRILPEEMSRRLMFIFAHDVEKQFIRGVPETERLALAQQVLKARIPIQLSWSEF